MHRSVALRWMAWVVVCLVGLSAARAQIDILSGKPLPGSVGGPAASQSPFEVSARITPASGKDPAQLWITADIQPDWHIFSITQKPGGPSRTKIQLDGSPSYKLLGDLSPDPIPTRHAEALWDGLEVEEHAGTVTWRVPVEITPGTDPAKLAITGKVVAQACNDGSCLPPASKPFKAVLSGEPAATTAAADAVKSPAPPIQPAAESEPFVSPERNLLDLPSADGAAGSFINPKIHAVVRGTFEPAVVVPGGKALLTLTAEPTDGYHVYALESSDPQKIGQGKPTLIVLEPSANFKLKPPVPSAAAHFDPKSGEKSYDKPIHWTVEIDVPTDAQPGQYPIVGLMGYQTCSGNNCDQPGGVRFEGKLVVGEVQQGGQLPLTFRLAKYGEVAAAASSLSVAAASTAGPIAASPVIDSTAPASLGTMILFSLVGGLILNLMPCVLPVIGLKILSFVEQAGKHRSHVLMLNIWYTLGLLSVFMILATLAVFLNLGWGTQFQSTAFNIVMSAIVFVMALSFLGVWEIPLPGFVGSSQANKLASREGAGGAFFKGMLTTVLATPCSGPFLGPVFGFTLKQPPAVTYLIFGCIGLGMASPYLLIGAFPRLIRFLPKPGAWMDTFKQMMAFVLLGTVVFMFTFMNKDYLVPTFALLIGLWAGCWWIGRTPLYEGWTKIGRAWVLGSVFAAVVGVASFHYLLPGPSLLPWQPYSPTTLAKLTSEGKTVMVDFTAEWCLTCKLNLKSAINTEEVQQVVETNGVVPLLADWTNESPEIQQALDSLGSKSIPVLAIFPAGQPNKPIILRDLLSRSQVVEALKSAGPSTNKPTAAATAMAKP